MKQIYEKNTYRQVCLFINFYVFLKRAKEQFFNKYPLLRRRDFISDKI